MHTHTHMRMQLQLLRGDKDRVALAKDLTVAQMVGHDGGWMQQCSVVQGCIQFRNASYSWVNAA